MLRLGIDRVGEYAQLFKGKRVGLITNPTGLSSSKEDSIEVLRRECDLTALYAAEHGIRGDRQDGSSIEGYTDPVSGLPVYSLYGERRIPSAGQLEGIDVLCYDMQDVGSRYYTFIYTLANAMEAAGRYGKEVVVFDRPDPIGGLAVSGSPMTPSCRSFIGQYDIPQRYGLTVGELALLYKDREGIDCRLHVVPMEGWERGMFYDETGLLWVAPSPNLPTLDAAVLYNGTCLFEGTNISEGRGTTHPFENIGAPWIDPYKWKKEIGRYGFEGVYFRPMSFIPVASKYKGEVCNGLYVHVLDRMAFDPLKLGLAMVLSAKKLFPGDFCFTAPRHEIGDFTIDLMYGSPRARDDKAVIRDLFDEIDAYSEGFKKTSWKDYLLYD